MMNNRCIAGIFLLAAVTTGYAFDTPLSQRNIAHSVMEKIAECRFDQAFTIADSALSVDSADPLGWMLKLSVIALQQLDYAETSESDDFETVYAKTQKVCSACENRNGNSSYLLTIKGFTKVIAAAHAMQQKRYFAGLRAGLDGIADCKEAKRIDSSNTDVDLVLGLYTYARAELKKKFLGILFWYPGDKLSGIQAIERCSREACFLSVPAAMILQEMYVKEGLYEQASEGIGRLLTTYPRNRFVLWTQAKMFDAQKAYSQAGQTYARMADAYEGIPGALQNLMLTRYCEAERYFLAGDADKAEKACGRLLELCKNNKHELCRDAQKLYLSIIGGK